MANAMQQKGRRRPYSCLWRTMKIIQGLDRFLRDNLSKLFFFFSFSSLDLGIGWWVFWSPSFSGPFPCSFLFLVNFTKNWSCDQILVIFTKNWSCYQFQLSSRPNFTKNWSRDQFQLSSGPNFGNFYQKLVTRPISIVITSIIQLKLVLWPIFGKNYQNLVARSIFDKIYQK